MTSPALARIPAKTHEAATTQATTEVPASFPVVVDPAGLQFKAQAGESLLTSARRAGVILPSSCRNGTCRSCLCSLSSGRVRYLIEWPGLSAEEKQQGFILPCVAVAESALSLRVEGARVGEA